MRFADKVGLLATRTLPRRMATDVDFGPRLVEFVENAVEPQRERLARFGQHHLARGAVEQLEAELRFEFMDRTADRGLRQSDLVAGAAEVAAIGDGPKDTQLTQAHIHAFESYIYPINPFLF